ncbi:hypothetical protein D1007_57854 [Hordeum vulgare]|nr:hypothetical protein D1007_57852 [Hordeum vulgare]KAE8770388.1 hypothetical protein D1007_57854 [Hordeum vulgare]
MKARGRNLHYLGGYSCRQARYDLHNIGCCSAFAKANRAQNWVCNDTDLSMACALDRFVTTTEKAARRCRILDDELVKIGEEWSLSNCSANVEAWPLPRFRRHGRQLPRRPSSPHSRRRSGSSARRRQQPDNDVAALRHLCAAGWTTTAAAG